LLIDNGGATDAYNQNNQQNGNAQFSVRIHTTDTVGLPFKSRATLTACVSLYNYSGHADKAVAKVVSKVGAVAKVEINHKQVNHKQVNHKQVNKEVNHKEVKAAEVAAVVVAEAARTSVHSREVVAAEEAVADSSCSTLTWHSSVTLRATFIATARSHVL